MDPGLKKKKSVNNDDDDAINIVEPKLSYILNLEFDDGRNTPVALPEIRKRIPCNPDLSRLRSEDER